MYSYFIVIAIVFSLFQFTEIALPKVAQASSICGSDETSLGSSGSSYMTISVRLELTSFACKEAFVTYVSDPRLTTSDYYYSSDGCQSNYTNNFDTSAFAGITQPVDVYVGVEAHGQDFNGECTYETATFLVHVIPDVVADFSLSCSPATATVSQGSATAASMTTSPQNGFNSGVTFNSSVSPATGNPPTVSFSNNGATPSATTTATITSASNTTPGTYNYTFDGSGGGQTHSCTMQVTVTANPGSFTLSVTPASNDVLKGNSAAFTVTANCAGSFTGPVHSLSASSFFTNVSYSFSSTSVNCGSSVTLTISGTGSVPQNQLSTPQSRVAQTVTVTGLGN